MIKLDTLKNKYRINKFPNVQGGMTYVELIVVLGIFAVMTSVILYDYRAFDEKIKIKNLASDIALKIVEAQKSSLSGKLPPPAQYYSLVYPTLWKPSYGFYADIATDNKSFIYFTDLDKNSTQNGFLQNPDCSSFTTGECLEKITITNGNIISALNVYYDSAENTPVPITNVNITFKRPDSTAIIKSTTALASNINRLEIVISSPQSYFHTIKVLPLGRIQVN